MTTKEAPDGPTGGNPQGNEGTSQHTHEPAKPQKSQFRPRHCTYTPPAQDINSQLKRRRAAALRTPPLDHSGRRDPWSRR